MHLKSLNLLHQMHLQENTLFDLDIGVKFTQNGIQYPLQYVTYVPAKFEIAGLTV